MYRIPLGRIMIPLLVVYGITGWEAAAQRSVVGPGVPAFQVRPGYRVDLVAGDIGEVRFIEFGKPGILYVSQPRTGAIVTLQQQGGVWSKLADFTTGKSTAHGMHYYDGWLWFTQSGVVWKARDTDGDGKADEEIMVTDDLPSGGGHWWRPILVTPDGFYTSIGDAGNITDQRDTERQKIWHFNLDGTGKRLYAAGLRNTEKLRLRPGTDEIWGADHGSDQYGQTLGETRGNQPFTDDLPPDEFNRYVDGGFYGHPFIVGPGLPRLEFKDLPDFLELSAKTILPEYSIGPHWAPNGWTFAQYDALGLKGDAIVACHGSWNSSVRVGYRVERIVFDDLTGKVIGGQLLVSCLSEDQQVLGRPCDVAEAPDGSLYFSDDSTRRIYRISRDNGEVPAVAAAAGVTAAVGGGNANQPFGALTYFQARCATCHGNYGEAYGDQFARDLDETALHEIIVKMVEGPAGAPLEAGELKALDDFHMALRDGRPYAAVTAQGEDGWIQGEALPGSVLTLEAEDRAIPIPLNGHDWRIQLPSGLANSSIRIQRNGEEVTRTLDDLIRE